MKKNTNKNMVKFAFCIFTYGEDCYMLGQCIRALRKLGATRSNIFVFDDAKQPLPYPPPNTQYKQTVFDRKGNLNGYDCTDGELLCMLEASKQCKADVVVKVDSDVIINSLEWVLNNDFMNSHCGFIIGEASHISGCTYSLPTWAIVPMLRKLKTLPNNTVTGESIIVTELASKVGLEKVGYLCNSKNSDMWLASSITDDSLKPDGTITSHSLGVMNNLQVVLCDLIATRRNKYRNYLLMKHYLDYTNTP